MTDHPSDPGPEPPGHPDAGGTGGEAAGGAPGQLVGSVLAGRYRIVRHLGEGAMGSVYMAEHLKFGRMDAIKVLHASMARDPEATRRFLRGARNVSAINHRNVCTVYDFSDTEDGLQFLAMEFVDGETLSDTLEREGSLPVARAVRIVQQAAAALQAAHDLGIVHRDLKPGNIMLTRDRAGSDLVKVVDFDIAKGSREGEGGDVTRMGFVVGTPEYMSPEQLTGDPLDGRSDIYSLALVLFRLLTGNLPIRATSTQDLLVERLTQDPLTLRDVAAARDFPDALQPVLDRALQRRRDDRHPTAAAFAEELAATLDSAPAAAPAAGGGLGATLETPSSSPSPPRSTPSGPELPATRVTDPGRAAPPSPPTGGGGAGRRYLAWGLGAAALVAVSWGGYMALSGGGEASSSREGGPSDDPSDEHVAAVDDSTEFPEFDRPTDSTAADRPTDTEEPTDPPTEDRLPDDDPDPTIEIPTFPVDQAEDVVVRQLERLDADEPASNLRAGADTATLVLDWERVPRPTRALAGFALGQLREALGDTSGAIRALERAVDLAPDNQTYRTYLRTLRGGPP